MTYSINSIWPHPMTDPLEYPDFVLKENENLLAIQINTDDVKYGWQDFIRHFAASWVIQHNFSKKATIWMHTELSIDFQSITNRPVMANFVVQFGLPSNFINSLSHNLSKRFGEEFFRFDYVDFEGYGSWLPISHIEQGTAWKQIDTDIWGPISAEAAVDAAVAAPRPTNSPGSHTTDNDVAGDSARKASNGSLKADRSSNDTVKAKRQRSGHLGGTRVGVDLQPRGVVRPRPHRRGSSWGVDFCDVRDVFHRGGSRSREEAVVELKRVTGDSVQEIRKILRKAVQRGIICQSGDGGLRMGARSVTAYKREFLKAQFAASMGRRRWRGLDESIRAFATWFGFRQAGPSFKKTTISIVKALGQEGRIERNGPLLRKIK